MMYKRFLSAIILVFAFLFLNMSFENINVTAAETLPEEIMANAGRGEKYWAVVNYGADYITSREIIIDIQKEAIADEEVQYIGIAETEHPFEAVWYQRNVNLEFSSRINYVLKNEEFGEKYITIFLLREFELNQLDTAIVDKIFVGINQKRNISVLNPEDFLVIRDVEEDIMSEYPYDIGITLDPTKIEGNVDDYVLDTVKYKLLEDENFQTTGAVKVEDNLFEFRVYRNGTYEVTVKDIFGYTKTIVVEVKNLMDPPIVIEVTIDEEYQKPVNHSYIADVKVYYYDTRDMLSAGELKTFTYEFNGVTKSIKESMQITISENGIYTIFAETYNGSDTEFILVIDNVDKEAPFVQVLTEMIVYTEGLSFFNPKAEIFVHDNVSEADKITTILAYYSVIMNNGNPEIGDRIALNNNEEESLKMAKDYLYSVRDLIIRYTVIDEAGNAVSKDSYVHSIDNTKPTITYSSSIMTLYINDPYPTAEEVERAYNLVAYDNSCVDTGDCNTRMEYVLDFKDLPVDNNNRLNRLGKNFRIYVRAKDESGNESEEVVLQAEVVQRLVTVEADPTQYIVYGDPMVAITYHCITRTEEIVDCKDELLEGDSISGEMYVLNAYYSGFYDILSSISIPSDFYSLKISDKNRVFEIKQRTIQVVSYSKEKDYLDPDPELTYEIGKVCNFTESDLEYETYKDYRCSLLDGDRFTGNIERYMGVPGEGVFSEGLTSEDVWYDAEGNVLPRKITQGTLAIVEQYNGSLYYNSNYIIDFVESDFTIWPKEVRAYIAEKEKIYGELDPTYTLDRCVGKPPIDTYGPDFCMSETRTTLTRVVSGEKVMMDNNGNYIDYYEINGTWTNKNYTVVFFTAYLTILKRDVEISVVGDLDANLNPTGKYTIYYEDNIPSVEVYDSSKGEKTGLVRSDILMIADTFKYGQAEIYDAKDVLVDEYVSGIGLYKIKKGTITIVDMNGEDAEINYNIDFKEGTLEVIKKHIWVKIIKSFEKIYGNADPFFTKEDLAPYNNYVILEANGRFIIEITPSTLQGEDPYIPRDNEKMKYHLKREDGIYVGIYKINIEDLEGCENYEVNLYEDYYFRINKRPIHIDIKNQRVVYKGTPNEFEYSYCEIYTEHPDGTRICVPPASLPYDDRVVGTPEVEEYRHVGDYTIGRGSITIVDIAEKDVSENYEINIHEGTMTVFQREIVIRIPDGQSKQYGQNDPEIKFTVLYQGVEEEIAEDDYEGSFGREPGEEPCNDCNVDEKGIYPVNIGTFKISEHDKDGTGNFVGNYIVEYQLDDSYFYIEKREIVIKARNVNSIYGNDYTPYIQFDTGGQLAFNETLKIGGYGINDVLQGELKVLGNVDGVGTYTISCNDIRIIRFHTGEDVTNKYYRYSYENGLLQISPRTLYITPNSGQYKLYGESDTGITFVCEAETVAGDRILCEEVLLDTDKWVGELKREPNVINDVAVTEDAGSYKISMGTLSVETESGKLNYELILNGSVTFTINPRVLNVIANDITIDYGEDLIFDCTNLAAGEECSLTYRIEGHGLANNEDLGIVDIITGQLNLERPYVGHGNYRILGDNLSVSNLRNYTYTFSPGLLIVNKRIITITPSEETLYKVYGERDPDYLKFTLDYPASYTGNLVREPGENVGKYLVKIGNLDFGENYEVILEEKYFTIMQRVINIKAENSGKIFGALDPVLRYTYIGTLIGNDAFFGSLGRTPGEEIGQYEINRGNLQIIDTETQLLKTDNYKINFEGAIFTIAYGPFTAIYIESETNNQYQVYGAEEEVRLKAKFNEGADPTHLSDVEWEITKILANGSKENIAYTKDANDVVSFTPSGSPGVYVVKASYDGIVGIYEVKVEISTIGSVFIAYVAGETKQILGKESEIAYRVIVPANTSSDATVQWIINGVTVQVNKVSEVYFYYTPNLGIGEYEVQAKIGNRISEPLYFYVENNNPPLIILNGDAVVYVEAKTGEAYIEPGAKVEDDIDGDITDRLIITGVVNSDVKNTYNIRYDATDSHGNRAVSVYRQVVVRDTTPPTITLKGNKKVTLLFGEVYDEKIHGGATAVDNYDGPVDVSISNNVDCNQVGVYEVLYTAQDSEFNTSMEVRIVEIIDNVSPIITLIGPDIMQVEVNTKFEDPGAEVYDNADGTFPIEGTSFYFGNEQVGFIDTSILGTYYVRYDYTDSSGNIAAGKVRQVEIVDTTAPVIKLKGENPYVIRYAYPNVNYVEPGAVAIDNYDEYVEVKIEGEVFGELGSYFIRYSAVDSNGNIAKTVTREVIIVDIESPIIRFFEDRCPQEMVLEAFIDKYDTRCDIPGWGIYVEDNYQADLEELQKRVVVRGTVDDKTIGLYVISYDVLDMSGNAAITKNRYVTVVDTTPPTIELIGDKEQIVEVFEPYQESGVIIKDLYDDYHGNNINKTISHNININKLGTYYVTYNAEDSNGNKAEPVVRIVHVKDTKPPVITLKGDSHIIIERGTSYNDPGASAYDLYDKSVNDKSIKHTLFPDGMHKGVYRIEFTAVDGSGNVGKATRIVEVVDTIPPIVLGVEDGKYYRDPVSIVFIPTPGTDEKLYGTLNGVEIKSGEYIDQDGDYELIVKDDANNKTTINFVIDRLPPQLLGIKNGEYTNREEVEIYTNEKRIQYFEYRYESGDWVRVEDQKMVVSREGTYRVYAVDMAGNMSDIYKFVIDRTLPVYTLTGVENKGITDQNVELVVEDEASVIVNALYSIPTIYTFTNDGYYQVVLRDLAGNTVNLQFVINKTKKITVNDKIISIYTQHNAIEKIVIQGKSYPRNSGYMLVIPKIEGGFTYVKGKLFSEEEYQALISGKSIEFAVSPTDDTSMFAAFVVDAEELNKFEMQTVDDPEDKDNTPIYIAMIIFLIGLFIFGFIFFIKRRKKEEEEEDVETTIYDDY